MVNQNNERRYKMNFKSINIGLLLFLLVIFCNTSSAQFYPSGGFQGGNHGSGGHVIPVGIADNKIVDDAFGLVSFPNPFHSSTTFRFSLARQSIVTLNVYDINNKLIRSLADLSQLGRGIHSIVWDGRNDNGHIIARGVYYYRLSTENQHITKKIIFL